MKSPNCKVNDFCALGCDQRCHFENAWMGEPMMTPQSKSVKEPEIMQDTIHAARWMFLIFAVFFFFALVMKTQSCVSHPISEEVAPEEPARELSLIEKCAQSIAENVDSIARIVYQEAQRGNVWEYYLITDCVTYRYWLDCERNGFRPFEQYMKTTAKKTFHGLQNVSNWGLLKSASASIQPPAGMVENVNRWAHIRSEVQNRLKSDVARQIRNYHHDKVKTVKLEGKRYPLNTEHIEKVRQDRKLKKLESPSLYHEFFEELEPREAFAQMRNELKKVIQ
jgi:hypothetical protein